MELRDSAHDGRARVGVTYVLRAAARLRAIRNVSGAIGWHVLTLVLAAIVLPVAVSASTAAHGGTSRIVIHTTGGISGIALDGHRVVYSRGAPIPHCAAIIAFDLATGRTTVVSGRGKWGACEADTSQLALAGDRVVWISEGESNSELWASLWMGSVPRRRERLLAHALTYFDYSLPASGDRVADLVGGGRLLVVNRWQVNKDGSPGKTVLYAIGPRGLRPILTSPRAIFAQAADAGRIAVLRNRPRRIEIYDRSGRRQLAIPGGRLRGNYRGDGLALQGDHLLVLKGRRLLVYDSHTGALRHRWPVPGKATNLDTFGGIAVYAKASGTGAPYTLHVLGLSTGKDVVLDHGLFATLRNLELGPSGLLYVKDGRTLVYLSFPRLLAAVQGR